jgi:hypothetical protein
VSADILNLRRARKAKARAEKDAEAEENRRRFGRTKEEKAKDTADRERAGRHIDGHRRDRNDR